MTKEEAINQLSIIYLGEFDKDREAKNMAISALTQLKKMERLSNIFEKTFDWGCNDEAQALYANAMYSCVHPDDTAFSDAIEMFEQHMIDFGGQ